MSGEILNGNGRFVLWDKPPAFPFSDIVTGTGEGPVFDLSVDLEFYSGVPYLKAEHVIEMARTLGMSTKEETANLRAEISHLDAKNTRLPNHVESLVDGINELVDSYRVSINADDASDPLFALDEVPEGADEIPSAGSNGSDKDAESGKNDSASKQSDKSTKHKGSAELSTGSDDGFGFE